MLFKAESDSKEGPIEQYSNGSDINQEVLETIPVLCFWLSSTPNQIHNFWTNSSLYVIWLQSREHLRRRDEMKERGRVKTQAGLNLSDRATSAPPSADRFKGVIHTALLRACVRRISWVTEVGHVGESIAAVCCCCLLQVQLCGCRQGVEEEVRVAGQSGVSAGGGLGATSSTTGAGPVGA